MEVWVDIENVDAEIFFASLNVCLFVWFAPGVVSQMMSILVVGKTASSSWQWTANLIFPSHCWFYSFVFDLCQNGIILNESCSIYFTDLNDNVIKDDSGDDENDDNADKMSRLYSSSLRPSFLMAPPWTHSIPSDITHLYFVFPNISNMSNSLSYLDHLDHQDVWGHRPFMPHIFYPCTLICQNSKYQSIQI